MSQTCSFLGPSFARVGLRALLCVGMEIDGFPGLQCFTVLHSKVEHQELMTVGSHRPIVLATKRPAHTQSALHTHLTTTKGKTSVPNIGLFLVLLFWLWRPLALAPSAGPHTLLWVLRAGCRRDLLCVRVRFIHISPSTRCITASHVNLWEATLYRVCSLRRWTVIYCLFWYIWYFLRSHISFPIVSILCVLRFLWHLLCFFMGFMVFCMLYVMSCRLYAISCGFFGISLGPRAHQ